MLISEKDIIDFIEDEKIITVVLKELRTYNGFFMAISKPNFDGDCLIEFKDRKDKYVKFKLSSINIIEE